MGFVCLGPVYQTLEAEEEDQSREQGNDLYESAGDVAPDDVKIEETESKGNDYQPLTLDRDAKALYKHGEIAGKNGRLCS